jgi:deoxyribonuclease-4
MKVPERAGSIRMAGMEEVKNGDNTAYDKGILLGGPEDNSCMLKIGAHLTISGGLSKMANLARDIGCEAVQIFSRSPRGGKPREFSENEIHTMRTILGDAGIRPLVVHAPYFVNLASDDISTRSYTKDVLVLDLMRSDMLNASYCVVHMGHNKDESRGLANAACVIKEVLAEYTPKCRLLLENAAGQGSEVGHRFSSLATVITALADIGLGDRLGICIDVCHAFAAGYDVRDAGGWTTIDDEICGVTRGMNRAQVYLLHLNDSHHPLGSRKDRHAHIGEGYIGLDGFRAILKSTAELRCRENQGFSGILETPTDKPNGYVEDIERLKEVRKLCR